MTCSRKPLRVLAALALIAACDRPTDGPDDEGADGKADAPSGLRGFACDWSAATKSGNSALVECQFDEAPFYVLQLRGSYEQISFDHGKLMARHIDAGPLSEINNLIRQNMDQGCELQPDSKVCRIKQGAIEALYRCWMGRMKRHVSDEFMDGTKALAAGYRQGFQEATGQPPTFSEQDIVEAALSIEFYNAVDGLLHEVSFTHAIPGVLAGLATVCAIQSVIDKVDTDVTVEEVESRMNDGDEFPSDVSEMGAPGKSFEFGCTGLTVPAAMTENGAHLHARNLDADLSSSWNKAPTLFLIDETESAPSGQTWFKYVAAGSAGLNFPGGISGLNEAGISVSLHQMSTTEYETGFLFGDGDIAPYLEQRILREAGSIQEAIEIAEDTQRFAAWTIFISDAKTGESARIEFNGDDIEVAPEDWKGKVVARGQSNHFLHPDMAETDFDLDDEHFTHNFNKYLETRSRLQWVTQRLADDAGRIGVRWAIDALAGHTDVFAAEQGGARGGLRAFGRTPVKAYGIMSTVTEIAPDADVYRIWVTLGDRLPAAHSFYLGFDVNWKDLTVGEVGALRTEQYDDMLSWVESLQTYVRARQAYVAHDVATHIGPEQQREITGAAEALLSQAIDQASRDGVSEVPYHFTRARIRHELEDHEGAAEDWKLLTDREDLAPYQRALVLLYSTATTDAAEASTEWPGRSDRLDQAQNLLLNAVESVAPHHDLEAKLDLLETLRSDPAAVSLPGVDFVTIE